MRLDLYHKCRGDHCGMRIIIVISYFTSFKFEILRKLIKQKGI